MARDYTLERLTYGTVKREPGWALSDEAERARDRHHQRAHNQPGQPSVPATDCWRCRRSEGRCRTKVTYPTNRDADNAATANNIRNGWPLTGAQRSYRCRWCGWYHTTSRVNRQQRRALERARRRWILTTRPPDSDTPETPENPSQ